MEEKDMLRFLVLIIFMILASLAGFINVGLASRSDIEWANSISNQSQIIVMDNFKEIMNQPRFDPELRLEVLKPRPALQIFVSSSLPKQLLKNYAIEARSYGGVLVFRGLPSDSIHKLTDLIMEISSENTAGMQIDDQAFTAFGIHNVPAIVLSVPAPIFAGETSMVKFDKVTGALTIKAALELFAQNGDMSSNAKELLK